MTKLLKSALAGMTLLRAAHAETDNDIRALQDQWAVVKYTLDKTHRPEAYQALADKADAVLAAQPENVEAHVWAGIIHSTWAGDSSAFIAMKHANRAKKELELALSMNPDVLGGSVYTSLGSLLYQIPGIMGGDEARAEEYLRKGVELNPRGIDSNYFYGAFLADQGRFGEAQDYVDRALAAPPRPGRDLADRGRREEARDLMARIAAKTH